MPDNFYVKGIVQNKFCIILTIASPSTNSAESNDMDSLTRRYSQDLMKAHAFDKLQEQLNKAQEVSNDHFQL